MYRFNDTRDTISEGYSTPIRFYKEKNKLINLLLRENICYMYTTDNIGFICDMLKLEMKY